MHFFPTHKKYMYNYIATEHRVGVQGNSAAMMSRGTSLLVHQAGEVQIRHHLISVLQIT